jgi:hypothetical protein
MAEQPHIPTIEEVEAEVMRVRERMGDWIPPSNDKWAELASPHLVNLRVAYLVVRQSPEKARELAEAYLEKESADGEAAIENVVESLMASAMYFHCLQEALWTGAQRLATYADEAEDINAT